MKSITNDIILVTGATRGIGKLMALELAKYEPKKIILWGRDETLLENLCDTIRSLSVDCEYQKCDVGDRDSIETCVEKLQDNDCMPSILINNAGIVTSGDYLLSVSDDEFERTMRVNMFAHFWTIRAFLPDMMKNNRGHIVDISSLASNFGIARLGPYCASKAASAIFVESLRGELYLCGCSDIHVTCVQPYIIDTDMFAKANLKYPILMRPLSAHWTARRIVEGILANEKQLILPRYMQALVIMKALLPIKVWQALSIQGGVEEFAKDLPKRW